MKIIKQYLSFLTLASFAFLFINAKTIENKALQDSRRFDRKWKIAKTPFNKTEDTGLIVLNICINTDGTVISASYNDEKSSTKDTSLINISIRAAYESSFSKDTMSDKIQCGTIKYNFKASKL